MRSAPDASAAAVVVLGSANRDLVSYVDTIPRPGETVVARAFETQPGGKGNNQAIAASRSGATTAFIVSLGADDGGRWLHEELTAAGVHVLGRCGEAPTGTAMVTVASDGENSIVVAPGANAELRGLSESDRAAIVDAEYLLMQLEVPLQIVCEAAEVAHEAGTVVVLNGAPAHVLPDDLLAVVDLLIVNEHEAGVVAGSTVPADAYADAARLSTRVGAVIVTLGAAGALIASRESSPTLVPGMPVEAVDTTGAGDTFCGALVAALADRALGGSTLGGPTLKDAARYATAAAALSVQANGAVPSIPWRRDVEAATSP